MTPIPPQQIADPEGLLTLRRAWPLPEGGDESRELAVELTDGARIRAGWWGREGLQLLGVGQDPVLQDLGQLAGGADGAQKAELISHRPEKRAVVRTRSSPLDEPAAAEFIKVVPKGKAAKILDGIGRAEPFAGPFRTPEVLHHTSSTVTFAALDGTTLHHPGELTAEQWVQAWSQVCQAWAIATETPRPASSSALVHRASAEIGVLRHWFTLTRRYLPDAEQAERSLEIISRQLSQLNPDRLAPSHRDLHDKQLLWSPDTGPGLLDVDTACLADPALDLGNLRAHAQLRQMQRLWHPGESETVRFCIDEVAEQCGVPRESVVVYERAALFRLGLVYAVRPQYADVATGLRQLL